MNSSATESWTNEDPVGAHTGLARVPELAGNAARHGEVEVRRLKHDEGRVSAELQPEPLDRAGALPVEDLAHVGGAGE